MRRRVGAHFKDSAGRCTQGESDGRQAQKEEPEARARAHLEVDG
jgi:hypothetical protein